MKFLPAHRYHPTIPRSQGRQVLPLFTAFLLTEDNASLRNTHSRILCPCHHFVAMALTVVEVKSHKHFLYGLYRQRVDKQEKKNDRKHIMSIVSQP